MSKLRADITYNHRFQSNMMINQYIQHIYNDISEQQFISIESQAEASTSNIAQEQDSSRLITMDEESDNELDNENELTDFEGNFDNYLQGWADMLEEEKERFEEENIEEEDFIEDITHPAVDKYAKWELASLFKELALPF